MLGKWRGYHLRADKPGVFPQGEKEYLFTKDKLIIRNQTGGFEHYHSYSRPGEAVFIGIDKSLGGVVYSNRLHKLAEGVHTHVIGAAANDDGTSPADFNEAVKSKKGQVFAFLGCKKGDTECDFDIFKDWHREYGYDESATDIAPPREGNTARVWEVSKGYDPRELDVFWNHNELQYSRFDGASQVPNSYAVGKKSNHAVTKDGVITYDLTVGDKKSHHGLKPLKTDSEYFRVVDWSMSTNRPITSSEDGYKAGNAAAVLITCIKPEFCDMKEARGKAPSKDLEMLSLF